MCIKLLKASVVFALLAILLGMPLLFTPHRIRPPYLAGIQKGMTEAEIEELLGAKSGNYDGYGPNGITTPGPSLGTVSEKKWCSRRGWVTVWFDRDGHVVGHSVDESDPVTWWAEICHRLVPPPTLTLQDRLGEDW